jgi:hypothetical protein
MTTDERIKMNRGLQIPLANIISHTMASLSQARDELATASSNGLVFFGGGYKTAGMASDRVDVYNVANGSWTIATLSVPRAELAATSSDGLVYFAGGYDRSAYYRRVDIYNALNRSWSTAALSQARCCLAATSVGTLVLFGGGRNSHGSSNVVDIYNVSNNTWTVATLSVARENLTATSVSNRYALFAGGWNAKIGFSNVVDIFDSLSGTWSTATLSQAREYLTATSLGNLAFFGGGITTGNQPSDVVDIFDVTTQTWSTTALSQPRGHLASASVGDTVAFGGGSGRSLFMSVVDMYNVTNNVWFTVNLSQYRAYFAATSSANKIFFGGGLGYGGRSDVVDIFEIPCSQYESDKLGEFCNNETLSDMTLIVKNTQFHLHKAILYARSEFFRQLLEANPQDTVYRIQDDSLNLTLFTCLLKYLYSDVITSVNQISEFHYDEFLKICEKYAMEHMQRIKKYLSLKYSGILTSNISKDLEKMVHNELFVDVKFKVNSDLIKAHKVVICSRSEYFRALCLGGLRESTQQQIEIHDTSPFLFKKLVEYLYTQRIDIDDVADNITEMFIVADKFGCVKLKEHLELVIAQNLTIENVSSLFLVAHRHSASTLKQQCHLFIKQNYQKVKRTREYQKFSKELESLLKTGCDTQNPSPLTNTSK